MRYLLVLLLATFLHAEEEPDLSFDLKITSHTIELEKGPLSYTAVTGMCPIMDEDKKVADLFFISYTKDDEENRPITFVFPGGPGGSGALESILSFGPRRLLTAGEGRSIHPP